MENIYSQQLINWFSRIIPAIGLALVLFMTVFAWPGTSQAVSPPNIISYQGRVLNSNGVPVSAATTDMQFRLYDSLSGGTCLWSNASSSCASTSDLSVTLTDGLFSENLGDTGASYAAIPDSVFDDNAAVYLEVDIEGETLSPRKRLAAVPYALNAESLDGLDSTDFLSDSGDTAAGDYDFTGAELLGASPLVFEGNSNDGNTTTFAFTDPSGANTITFQDGSGTVAFTSDLTATQDFDGVYDADADQTLDIDHANGLTFDLVSTSDMVIADNGTPFATFDDTGNITFVNDFTVDTDTFFVDASTNRIGSGTTTPGLTFDIRRDEATYLGLTTYDTTDNSIFLARRARGSQATPAAVQGGDVLASYRARGYTGTGFSNINAKIDLLANQTYNATDGGSRIEFHTIDDDTTTLDLRLTIDDSGHLVPGSDDSYDLGTSTARWRDLYVGGDSIHLGTNADEAEINFSGGIFGIDSTDDGSDDLVIDADGQVGIGLTNPGAELEIAQLSTNGNRAIEIDILADADGEIVTGIYTTASTGTATLDTGLREADAMHTVLEGAAHYDSGDQYYPYTVGLYNEFADMSGTSGYVAGSWNYNPNTSEVFNGYAVGTFNELKTSAATSNAYLYGMNNQIFFLSGSGTGGSAMGALNNLQSVDSTAAETLYGTNTLLSTGTSDVGYGLRIVNPGGGSTGGTQYGVYLNIDDADVTRWGIYEAGGATNYLTGNLGLDTSSPDAILDIEAAEDIERIRLTDSTNTDSTGLYTGTGTPDGSLSAQAGSIFLDQTGTIYVNTDGGTTWVDLTTAGGADTFESVYSNDGDKALTVNSGSGFTIDLTSTGDFTIEDNGTPYAIFDDSGLFSLTGTGNLLTLGDGTATDFSITFDEDTNDGIITWDASADEFDFNSNLNVNGGASFTGGVNINGTSITLGDATTDTVTFNADVGSNIIPNINDLYTLGTSEYRWEELYLGPQSLHMGSDGDEGILEFNTAVDDFYFNQDVQIASGAVYKISSSEVLHKRGTSSISVGSGAGDSMTTASQNTLIGDGAGTDITSSGNSNTFVGRNAGQNVTTGDNNILLGVSTASSMTSGQDNVIIGTTAGGGTDSDYNVVIGNSAASLLTGDSNILIGRNVADAHTSGTRNIILGEDAGNALTTTGQNLILGYQAGYTTTGTGNIFLGYQAGYNETGGNKLYIDNSNTTTPLIYGDFSADNLIFYGDVTATDDVTLGTSTTDVITVNGYIASNLVPNADDTYDLGSSNYRWRDLYLGPTSLHIGTNGNEGIIGYSTSDNKFDFNQDIQLATGKKIFSSGRIEAAAHAANQGLRLPTNSGVPGAVAGTSTGDVVFDFANDDLYVFDGSGFLQMNGGGASSLDEAYNGGSSITVDSGAVTLSGTGSLLELGNGTASDYTITFNEDGTDGTMTWDASANEFAFNNSLNISGGVTTSGSLNINGTTNLNGSAINLGNATTDTTSVTGEFVLGNFNGSNPAGSNGMMYYDVDESKFKCYQNGSWTDCIATPTGGNTLDAAYDQGGAGSGRTISVDSGAVALSGTGNLLQLGDGTSSTFSIVFDEDGTDGTISYDAPNDEFDFSHNLNVAGGAQFAGGVSINGTSTNIGDATTDDLTVNAILQGDIPLVFEGNTANAYEIFFDMPDPTTTDRTITFQDASGTVALTSDLSGFASSLDEAYDGGSSITVDSGAVTLNGTGNLLTLGDGTATDFSITFDEDTNDGIITWDASADEFDFNSNLNVNGGASFTGGVNIDGSSITLGNATTDTITANAYFGSDLIPNTDDTYDLGSSNYRWQDLYLGPDSLHIYGNASEMGGSALDWRLSVSTSGSNQSNLQIHQDSNQFMNLGIVGATNPIVSLGYRAGANVTNGGVYIGANTANLINASSNTYVGAGIMNGALTDGGSNTIVGDGAVSSSSGIGQNNALLGAGSGNNLEGDDNVFLGYHAGRLTTTANSNVFIGKEAGFNNIVGGSNIFLGYQAGYNETGSNKLYIDNSNTSTPLIYGDFSTDNLIFYGDITATDDVVLGTQNTDALTINSEIRGGTPLVFEGTSDDNVYTSFNITDPTSARTITFPNSSGTVAFTSQIPTVYWQQGSFAVYEDDNDVVVGTSGDETIANAGFSLTGDDFFVTGDAGIEGNVYTDGSFIAGSTLTMNDSGLTDSDGDMNFTSSSDGFNFTLGGGAGDDFNVDSGTFVVESDQNEVGIGTTSPGYALDVVGDVNINSTNNALRIGGTEILSTDGNSTVFLGYNAGLNNSAGSGTSNTFIGENAGRTVTTADYNTMVGADAGYSTTGSYNTFLGRRAGYTNGTGAYNTYIGQSAGYSGSSGSSNVAVGHEAGYSNTLYSNNTFVGVGAGRSVTTSSNTMIGFYAGYNTSGGNNVYIGDYAGYNGTLADGNVFIGHQAGYNETGDDKLYIDNSNTSNPLIWGDFSANDVNINGSLGVDNSSPFYDLDIGSSSSTGNSTVAITSPYDAYLRLVADTDNVTESHNPWIYMSQDNGAVEAQLGLVGNAGTAPDNSSYTDTTQDSLFLGTPDSQDLQLGTSGQVRMHIAQNGHVGIDVIDPYLLFEVTDSRSIALVEFENTYDNGASDVLDLQIHVTTPGTGNNFVTFYDEDSAVGNIDGNGSGSVRYNTSGADYAEIFEGTASDFASGDIVGMDNTGQIVLASINIAPIGAHSANSAFLGNATEDWDDNPNVVPVGLLGQLPVNVNNENGAITAGDFISISSTDGVGMKADLPSNVVGTALEDWSGPGEGTISVYIKPHWNAGGAIANDGTYSTFENDFAFEATGTADATTEGYDSYGLTFRGSGYDGAAMEAKDVEMTLVADVTDYNDYSLSVQNTAGTQVALVSDEGDLAISGKLYPSAQGTLQTDKYIYYGGSSDDYMRTNASGWGTGSYDFAELFPSSQTLEAGELVVFASQNEHVRRSTAAYDGKLAGIVSTKPGFLAGNPEEDTYPIALAGRVPTKVNLEGGTIEVGDPITSSSIAGTGMKASEVGMIVGYALEPYSGAAGQDEEIIVFVNTSYYAGNGTEPDAGTDNTASGTTSSNLTSLNMEGNIYMHGFDIRNVGVINGVGDSWKIEADGTFLTESVIKTVIESYQNEPVETTAVTSTETVITLTGSSELDGGQATITFEDIKAEFNDITSTTAPINVVVTPNGPVSLYVSDKDHNGFTVRQIGGSDSGVTFDWLVTAFRKDYEPVEETVEDPIVIEPTTDPGATATDDTATTDTTIVDGGGIDTATTDVTDPIVIDEPTDPEPTATTDATVVDGDGTDTATTDVTDPLVIDPPEEPTA